MTKALLLALALFFSGCRNDMFQQPRYRGFEPSKFFPDGRSARPIPPGTFRYGEQYAGDAVEQGSSGGAFVTTVPISVDEALLRRGHERFDIFCSPCHGRTGDGHGMIAKRGLIQPADLHSDRVRNAPPGYLYAVISNGYGAMAQFGTRVPVRDRWAIVAYIRALELSRRSTVADVPPEKRGELERTQ